MESYKWVALLYCAAGLFFFASAFLGRNIISIVLGCVMLVLGFRTYRNGKDRENQ